MKAYTDVTFYDRFYLSGRGPKIPEKEFDYWSMLATSMIRNSTFGNIENLPDIPAEVQMCCCEVAEKLYMAEASKQENGLILQSYGNDGETATFKTEDMSEDAVRNGALQIICKWLACTGFMYCGV